MQIKRDPFPDEPSTITGGDGLVYMGDACFAIGDRPDVAARYPNYPLNYRAGWSFTLSRRALPGEGRTFGIHVIASAMRGGRTSLGTRTITFCGSALAKPFVAYAERKNDFESRLEIPPLSDIV